jgi:hypothetical protein
MRLVIDVWNWMARTAWVCTPCTIGTCTAKYIVPDVEKCYCLCKEKVSGPVSLAVYPGRYESTQSL